MNVTWKENADKTKLYASWAAVPGAQGFSFWKDGIRISYTMDGARTSVTFGLDGKPHTFEVRALSKLDSASTEYPLPAPPPPPPPPPTTGWRLGISNNLSGGGNRQHVLDLGVKMIREDSPGQAIVDWAHQNGITVVGIVFGATSSPADVWDGDNEPYNSSTWDVAGWAGRMLASAKAARAANKKFILPVGPPWNNGNVLYGAVFPRAIHHELTATHNEFRALKYGRLEGDDLKAHLKMMEEKYAGTWTDCVAAINMAQPTIWQYVDGISIHPYSQPYDPSIRTAILDKWRSNLNQIGHGSIPFWLTEVGWPTGGNTWPGATYNDASQASYYTKMFSTFGGRSDVAAIVCYRLDDFGARDSNSEHYFGIVNTDGSHKQAWSVVKGKVTA